MAHSLLGTPVDMPSPRNDDDLICSCRHPACTITSVWRAASARRVEANAVPEPLPFDLSDTSVSERTWYRVPSPPPGVPSPWRLSTQRVA